MKDSHAAIFNNLGSVRRAFGFARILGTNVRGKLFVSQCHEIVRHGVKSLSSRWISRLEYPFALGAAPTEKIRPVYPNQLSYGHLPGIVLHCVRYRTQYISAVLWKVPSVRRQELQPDLISESYMSTSAH